MAAVTPPTFSGDTVVDDVTSDLNFVRDFVRNQLNDKLADVENYLKGPDLDLAALKQKTSELVTLLKASQHADNSLEEMRKGQESEKQILQAAADPTVPVEQFKSHADKWAADAAACFAQSRNNATQAAQIVSAQPGFLASLTTYLKKISNTNLLKSNPFTEFTNKISSITFGLTVLSSRVTHLPRVLMEQLEQNIDRRVIAVSEVVNHWKSRALGEYQTLRQDLRQVVDSAAAKVEDTTSRVSDTVQTNVDKVIAAEQAFTTLIQTNVEHVLANHVEPFIRGLKDRIKGWSASVYDLMHEQKTSFGQLYSEKLDQRRPQPPPLPERIEPKMP